MTTPHQSPLPPLDAHLRSIICLIFVPGFVLCLVHGAINDEIFPAVGAVGLFLSAVYSTIVLSRANKGKRTSPWLTYIQDWFMGAVSLTFLILSWVWLSRWRARGGILGAYGTMPILVNFCIHAYFALRAPMAGIFAALMGGGQFADCPHCHEPLRAPKQVRVEEAKPKPTVQRGGYSLLGDRDEEASLIDDRTERPSQETMPDDPNWPANERAGPSKVSMESNVTRVA